MVLGSYKVEGMGTIIFGLVCGRGGILCVFGRLVVFVLGLLGLFIRGGILFVVGNAL